MEQSSLQFIPNTPLIDIGFWTTLSRKKIEDYKLDDSVRHIITKSKINSHKERYSHLAFDIYSFNEVEYNKSGPYESYVQTDLHCYNTSEAYQQNNVEQFLNDKLKQIGHSEKIVSASIFMFADLKKYIYKYKVVVPQVKIEQYQVLEKKPLNELPQLEQTQLSDALRNLIQLSTLATNISQPYMFIDTTNYERISLEQAKINSNIIVIFFDSFNGEQINGTFQNLLALMINHKFQKVKFIIFKDFLSYSTQKLEFKNSLLLHLDLGNAKIVHSEDGQIVPFDLPHYSKEKEIDLRGFMDERLLARDAVDLNIKLMKWRMLPNVNLEVIKSTRCLLFGAGTLGCQLARNLIGWGIRNITFVDYGKVSYSNPVRQTLYDFEDSCHGGRPKAEVAAEKLIKIFPDINAKGVQIEIPMPGHFVGPTKAKQVIEDLSIIDALVEQHDVVYLLTDSREARWLPTVLANKHKKICFAVALGFDSFIIIRHGMSVLCHDPQIHGDRLSCYYCNDISAPADSMKDRTLDQQCTVTRPGLSFLAAAYASELMVSLVQHPLRDGAPANENNEQLETTDLGVLPHFLRGQLSDFEVKMFYGKSFNKCVACSKPILEEYLKNRDEFILTVLNDPDHLQKVSGIAESMKLQQEFHEIEIIDDFAVIT